MTAWGWWLKWQGAHPSSLEGRALLAFQYCTDTPPLTEAQCLEVAQVAMDNHTNIWHGHAIWKGGPSGCSCRPCREKRGELTPHQFDKEGGYDL